MRPATEIYGHLLHHVAHQAVDAIDTALDHAGHQIPNRGDHTATTATPARPQVDATTGLSEGRPHATTLRPHPARQHPAQHP